MKFIIFAGGTGRRLWPISRKQSPKQFEPIIGSRSTVQLAVDRVARQYGAENVYVSTNERYHEIIAQQLPEVPPANLIAEPVRRDLAPAVGLAMAHLSHPMSEEEQAKEPVAILWGDNYMSEEDTFRSLLQAAAGVIRDGRAGIVFIGETPRYANENLGWIEMGERAGQSTEHSFYAFRSWSYRPSLERCHELLASGNYVWNTGYFVTTIHFVRKLFEEYQPQMTRQLAEIKAAIGSPQYETTLRAVYPAMRTISFDDAILVHVRPEDAVVLHDRMGWSDPGTLYALKEAIEPDLSRNVEMGQVLAHDSRDCLLYNYEPGKLLTVIGLEHMIVVNTPDAILVVPRDQVPQVKTIVDGLEGTELEKYS